MWILLRARATSRLRVSTNLLSVLLLGRQRRSIGDAWKERFAARFHISACNWLRNSSTSRPGRISFSHRPRKKRAIPVDSDQAGPLGTRPGTIW